MSPKRLPTVSRVPDPQPGTGRELSDGEGRDAGRGKGYEYDISPGYQSPSDIDEKYDRLTRELVLISVVFVVMIAFAWAMISGVFTGEKEARTNWLRVAQARMSEDRLTHPPDDNALEAYLKAQQLAVASSAVDGGLEAIGQRYLEMIDSLTRNRDLELASATLDAAARVIPHAPSDYAYALAEARERLESLTQAMAQERQSARSTGETDEPLMVFQDYLKDGTLGPEMVVLSGGNFVLGSPDSELGRDPDEGPAHPVSIRRFAMAKTEATFAEYRVFADAAGWALPDDFNWGHGQQPLINVTWVEATAYATWLSEQTGFRYRLPTEAEWEYAARADTTTPFVNGECLTPDYANVDFRVRSELCPSIPVSLGRPVPVGDRQPNPWGLHNLYGNVREWVRDCWASNYDPLLTDGSAYYSAEGGSCGAADQRVLRGGAWPSPTSSARTANRFASPAQEWANSVGFRVVRELD